MLSTASNAVGLLFIFLGVVVFGAFGPMIPGTASLAPLGFLALVVALMFLGLGSVLKTR